MVLLSSFLCNDLDFLDYSITTGEYIKFWNGLK